MIFQNAQSFLIVGHGQDLPASEQRAYARLVPVTHDVLSNFPQPANPKEHRTDRLGSGLPDCTSLQADLSVNVHLTPRCSTLGSMDGRAATTETNQEETLHSHLPDGKPTMKAFEPFSNAFSSATSYGEPWGPKTGPSSEFAEILDVSGDLTQKSLGQLRLEAQKIAPTCSRSGF